MTKATTISFRRIINMEDKKIKDQTTEAIVDGEAVEAEVVTSDVKDDEGNSLLIKFAKPYLFEGKEYTEVDLSGLERLNAASMIDVNRKMSRGQSGIDVLPEVSLEYAINIAEKATTLPIEFFLCLPPKEAIKVKNRVMGFLFGSD